jgi:hypothetical protein
LVQAVQEKRLTVLAFNYWKIDESTRLLNFDSLSMPREQKGKDRPANGSAGKSGGGTICALCGRVMKPGSAASQEPAIYSICAACKRMPYRNPGSTASLR